MPTYDYECPKCCHKFELLQKMNEKPISKCPKCGSKKVKRLIGAGSGIIFKGTGFYETDYKRKEDKSSVSCSLKGTKKECSSNKCPANK